MAADEGLRSLGITLAGAPVGEPLITQNVSRCDRAEADGPLD